MIAADPHAQVYEAERNTLKVYGCAGHGRSYLLGEVVAEIGHGPFSGVSTKTLALAGTDVAFWEEGERSSPLIVRDLRTGRMLHKLQIGTPPLIEADNGYATAIVVKSDGSVAWIVGHSFGAAESLGPPPVYEVEAADKPGRRVLASGTDIDPSSLALAGSTLYWTQGGKPASALLR